MACAADDQSALVIRGEAVIKHNGWLLPSEQVAGFSVAMVATGRPAIHSSGLDEMASADRGMS